MQLLMLAPPLLHASHHPEGIGNVGTMTAKPVDVEKQPSDRQMLRTLVSLLLGRRKSSLL